MMDDKKYSAPIVEAALAWYAARCATRVSPQALAATEVDLHNAIEKLWFHRS